MRLHTGNLKRFLAMFLLVTVVCSSRGLPVTAASADGSVSSNDVNPTQQEIVVQEEYYDLGEAQTSAVGMSFFSLTNGIVESTATNEVQWIDRIVLEENLRAVYDRLVEGSDNDGVADILIDDSYFDGDHSIVVGTETVALDEANGITTDVAMNEVYGRYEPFINAVCSAFDRDHPEVFWLNGTWSSSVSASSAGTNCTVTVSIVLQNTANATDVRADAYRSQQSIKAAIAERDTNVNAILAEANTKSGVYEKIKLFNETLTKSNEYNTSTELNQIDHSCRECISALTGSSGTAGPVCEGYARAFKVLCDAAGIPCVLVDGQATNSSGQTEAHMWNYAQVDGVWYAVDVTWNDPVVDGESGVASGYESEDWLLVGSGTEINGKTFIDSHPVSNTVLGSQPHPFTNGPELSVSAYVYQPTVADAEVTLGIPADGYTYDGLAKEPDVTVKLNGQTLTKDTDYTVTYFNNIDAGPSAEVIVTGRGSYSGEVTKNFAIAQKVITPSVTVYDKEYDGTTTASNVDVNLDGMLEQRDETEVGVSAEANFETSAVGNGIPVTISLTVSGNRAFNYAVLTPVGVTGNIVARPITIAAKPNEKYYGEDDPELTSYEITNGNVVEGESLDVRLNREAGEEAGTYEILLDASTHSANPNYEITYNPADFTITKAPYTAEVVSEQTVIYGVGTFVEPKFFAKDGKPIEGTLTYKFGALSYNYAEWEAQLKRMNKDSNVLVEYTFVPTDTNYDGNKSGNIQFSIKDVEFLVADSPATTDNAVTIKANPTYGDSWAEIIKLNDITARIDKESDTDASHFTLDVSGTDIPAAGEQTFHVYYNGTIAGNVFTNVLVCTGTVNVNKRMITVDAGDYMVSKIYDGTTELGTEIGNLEFSGVLSGEEDTVAVITDVPVYTDADAGAQNSINISLILMGSGIGNYQLEADILSVPCEITRRPVTVQAADVRKVYGAEDPSFLWELSEGTSLVDGESLSGELTREQGDHVGTYEITQGTLTDENNKNYQITFKPGALTIEPASYNSQVTERQAVIQGVYSFVEPAFTGVDGEAVPGTLTYTYNGRSGFSYDDLVEQLKKSSEASAAVQYSFIPVADGNYTGESSGTINLTAETIKFYAGQAEADEENAVTEKADPVYGDTWGDILKLNTDLFAQLLTETDRDQSHFRLDVTDTEQPAAGQQTYHIYYSGTLKGVSFENVVVCSGTVTVAPKMVTPQPGTCVVSKEYDGTTAAGTVTGEPQLEGVLDKDAGTVSLIVQPAAYTQAGIHSGAVMRVTVSLDGIGKNNYQLDTDTINVPCMITRRKVTVEAGDYIVSKIYDGTTSAGAGEVDDLIVSGILEQDKDDVGIAVDQIPEYTHPNVGGQSTLVVELALSGDKVNNYNLAETNLEVPCRIVPMTIQPVITVVGTYDYTGSPIEPAFAVTYENGSLTAADYTAAYSDNLNAGTGKISLTAKEGGNYIWEGTVEQTFDIQKIEYTGSKEAAVSVMYGNQGTLDLTARLPEGAKLSQLSVVDAHSILSGTAAVSETVLGWNMADDAEKTGKTAKITVPVTETTNYLPFDLIVTVTCVEKNPQTEFAFSNATVNKVYGDSAFTEAAQGAAEDSTVTYTSSNTNVAIVDNSGKVQIVGTGTVVITASASETNAYTSATASYTLNITPKALTWDVSGLSATDREDSITNKAATLNGELKVTGILDADKAKVSFTCPADQLTGVYQTVTPGTVPVELVWTDTAQPVTLQGEKASNYLLPASLPQIKGTIQEVMDNVPIPPESTDTKQYKLSVEIGVSNVPDALKDLEKWNTLEKITTEMKLSIQKRTSDIPASNVEVYDVELLININGTGWVKATKENFPKDGLTVTLPYPNGTGKETHDFTVAHLFVQDMNGRKAGDLEYPAVTKTDEGIQFKVYGLSPISIGWKAVTLTEGGASDSQPEDNQPPKTDDSTDSGAPAPSQTSEQTSSQIVAPATGDTAPIMLYILLLGVACISMVAVLRRRITNK